MDDVALLIIRAEPLALPDSAVLNPLKVEPPILAAINELHYTIWTSKSVLPILFIVFAILGNIQDKKLFSPKYDKELAFNSSVDERALEIKT